MESFETVEDLEAPPQRQSRTEKLCEAIRKGDIGEVERMLNTTASEVWRDTVDRVRKLVQKWNIAKWIDSI